MLTIRTDTPHPMYGSGALFIVSLPAMPGIDQQNPELAARLNMSQLNQLEAGYGFGAWCRDMNVAGTAYAIFLPSADISTRSARRHNQVIRIQSAVSTSVLGLGK
jgi:hypothetical protein